MLPSVQEWRYVHLPWYNLKCGSWCQAYTHFDAKLWCLPKGAMGVIATWTICQYHSIAAIGKPQVMNVQNAL